MSGTADIGGLRGALEAIAIGSVDVDRSPDGTAFAALVPFEQRELSGSIELHLFVAPNDTTLVLATEVHDIDPVLMDAHAEVCGVDWEAEDDVEADVLRLLIGREIQTDEIEDIAEMTSRLISELRSFVDAGAVQLVDVTALDEAFQADLESIALLKREHPRRAADLLEDLAGRAVDLAAVSMAAELRLARAELLNDMGSVGEALAIAEEQWTLLAEPLHRTDLVATYTGVLARAGSIDRALELTRACLDVADDPEGRAALIGNLGAFLHLAGRRGESIEWLTAAIDDPFISDADRATLEANLILIQGLDPRSGRFTNETEAEPDLLADVDRWIVQIAYEFGALSDMPRLERAMALARPQLRKYLAMRELLGPSQQVRLLLIEAQFEARFGRQHSRRANELVSEAAALAATNADPVLIKGVEEVARLIGVEQALDPLHRPGPEEQLAITTNRVHREMLALGPRGTPRDGATWLAQLAEVIDAANEEIRRYGDLRTRDSRRGLKQRTFELAMVAAHLADSPEGVLDMIERLRDQGSPTRATSTVDDEVERLVAERVRRSPTTLRLDPHVRVRSNSRAPDEVNLAEVADAVAGPGAWWWSAHLFEERLHWGLRAPDGQCWAGVAADVSAVGRWVRSSSATVPPDHTTNLDAERIDLAAIASELLPTPLISAAEAAVRTGSPARVACALSSELNSIPLLLLPLPSGARVLDGMITVKAPPSWVHRASTEAEERPRTSGNTAIALGGDPRIGDVPEFNGLRSLEGRVRLMGGPAQLRSGSCTELATPQAVEASWSGDATDIGVFYGHIIPGTESAPLGGGLELCDDRGRPARWTVGSMLAGDPGVLARVVVLAGCASMGFATQPTSEWWGPACGLLWRGANYVVGTQWEVAHGPTNTSFVADLVARLRSSGDDVPAALRAAQLLRLRRFTPDAVIDRSELPVWSAYSVVGATPLAGA